MKEKYQKCVELARALKPAEQEMRQFHVGIIFEKNKIVTIRSNKRKTHPQSLKYNYEGHRDCLHAELNAVLGGRREDYSGCSMVVVRIDNNGNAANSRPCRGCQDLLRKTNFKKVCYSISDYEFGTLFSN